jgi:hypothetical protein
MTDHQPTERNELAVRHTISSIMSGRADVDHVVRRLIDQGFQSYEIDVILKEASRRMDAFGKASDHDFYRTAIKAGLAMLALAVCILMTVGYPQHGRGVGIFYSAILFGFAALAYGLFGKVFRH